MRFKSNTASGYLMILLSAVGYGSYGLWARLMGHEFPVFYQGWIRSLLVLIILVPIAIYTKSLKSVRREDWPWILTPVLLGALTAGPAYYAFNHMDIGTATLLYYSFFLVVSYTIGRLFLKENLTKIKIASFVMAIIGLVILFGFSLEKFSLLALFCAIAYGVFSGSEVATTKKTSHSYSALQLSIFVWAGSLIVNFVLSLLLREPQVLPQMNIAWLAMFGFAITGLIVFWLAVAGFKHVDASIGSLIGLFEIISGVFFGVLFFHELLTGSILLGGGLIMLSAMLPDLSALIRRTRMNKPIPLESPVI